MPPTTIGRNYFNRDGMSYSRSGSKTLRARVIPIKLIDEDVQIEPFLPKISN